MENAVFLVQFVILIISVDMVWTATPSSVRCKVSTYLAYLLESVDFGLESSMDWLIAAIDSMEFAISPSRFPKIFCSFTVKCSHNAVAIAFAKILASLAIGLLFGIVQNLTIYRLLFQHMHLLIVW